MSDIVAYVVALNTKTRCHYLSRKGNWTKSLEKAIKCLSESDACILIERLKGKKFLNSKEYGLQKVCLRELPKYQISLITEEE